MFHNFYLSYYYYINLIAIAASNHPATEDAPVGGIQDAIAAPMPRTSVGVYVGYDPTITQQSRPIPYYRVGQKPKNTTGRMVIPVAKVLQYRNINTISPELSRASSVLL
jgi:hypothetical protein